MNRTFLTYNGNIFLVKGGKGYFHKNNGEFLRYCAEREIEYFAQNLPEISFKNEPMWHEPVKWTMLWATSERDLSKFKAETSSNGGDYAFGEMKYAFARLNNGKWEFIVFSTYNTSAEFEFDELMGGFQIGLKDCYAVDVDQLFWVKSQIGDFSISQYGIPSTLEDVLKMKNHWIVKSDDDEIESYSDKLPFSELKRRFLILQKIGIKRTKQKNAKRRR